MSSNSQKSLVRWQDTLPISIVQEAAENRPICSSGEQTNARGFCYDDIVEAWRGTPQTWP